MVCQLDAQGLVDPIPPGQWCFLSLKIVYHMTKLGRSGLKCDGLANSPDFRHTMRQNKILTQMVIRVVATDKRTDVWSRDFIVWKINSGLWAVVWAGLWNKRVWADYEQLLRPVFSLFRGKIFFFFNFVKKVLCNFSVRTLVFQKKIFNFFLTPKKWKNGPQKLLIIGPDPFISQSSPDQRPTAQNWFFILWNLGTRHLFSYLCINPIIIS